MAGELAARETLRPPKAMLEKYGLTQYVDITRAIKTGNVNLFTQKMDEYNTEFLKAGTYLLMMKLKVMVYLWVSH